MEKYDIYKYTILTPILDLEIHNLHSIYCQNEPLDPSAFSGYLIKDELWNMEVRIRTFYAYDLENS